MKNALLFLSVILFSNAASALGPYDIRTTQRDPTNMFFVVRDMSIPLAAQDGIFIVDGSTSVPVYATLGSGLVFTGGSTNQLSVAGVDYNTLANLPAARSFNYPSRALNSCFQISPTQDADFHYRVDVTSSLNLTAGAQGTVTATSYTNNSCTTGGQAMVDGTSAQTGTLIVGLGIGQITSVSLDGTIPAGKYMKITTVNTVGTPTFAIRSVQSEVLQ